MVLQRKKEKENLSVSCVIRNQIVIKTRLETYLSKLGFSKQTNYCVKID